MKKISSSLLKPMLIVSLGGLLSYTQAASAQVLEEIIVTAQKKSQNLQDVPIAISAYDLAAIENYRIEGLEDIANSTPGVYVTQNPADQNGVRINIRGIGTFDPQIGQDSRVAIYQDGVYYGKTQGLATDFPDLERIEILKGPQGTLYGRNTVAGAVNIISAKPDPSALSGKVNVEFGNFEHAKAASSINIPLGERTAVRLSASFLTRDGWVENDGPGSDFGGEEKTGFKIALGHEFSDAFRLDIIADYNETEKEPLLYQTFGPAAAPFGSLTPDNPGRQEDITTSFAPEEGNAEVGGISITGTWALSETDELKGQISYREADSSRFVTLLPEVNAAGLNQIIGGFNQAILPLPFAFGAVGQQLRPDFAATIAGRPAQQGLFISEEGGAPSLEDHEQFSAELTYNGSFNNGRIEYTGGLFYYDETTGTGPTIDNQVDSQAYLQFLGQFAPQLTAPNIAGVVAPFSPTPLGPIPAAGVLLGILGGQIPGNQAGAFPLLSQLVGNGTSCGPTDAPSPANNFCIPTLSVALANLRAATASSLTIDTTAFAAYGQATFHVSDNFRITAGLRYSDESKDGFHQTVSPLFNDATDITGGTIAPNVSSFDEDILDPSLVLEWDVSQDMLLYASYKESFRSGGFNAAAVGLPLPGETFSNDFNFDEESITAYEIGFKGTFNNSIRINAAAFFYDFEDTQTTVSTNPIIATQRAVVNTDDEIYGFEVDGVFVLSDNFTLRASYSFIDGDAGDVVNPITGVVEVRDELQGTPQNSWLIGLDYNDTWGQQPVFGNITYTDTDEVLLIPQNDLRLPSFELLSARIGVSFQDADGKGATVSLWGTNLTDEEYLIDGLPFETFARETAVFGQPRSYGIGIGYNF